MVLNIPINDYNYIQISPAPKAKKRDQKRHWYREPALTETGRESETEKKKNFYNIFPIFTSQSRIIMKNTYVK